MAHSATRSAVDNELFARLPEQLQGRLKHAGRVVEERSGSRLQAAGDPIVEFTFPLTGLVSLTMDTSDGQSVEVAVVGAEGFVGISRFLGVPNSQWSAVVQVPGTMFHVPADIFESHGAAEELRDLIDRVAASLMVEMAQSAVCNKLHTIEQRTARWLLHATDRARTTDLELTHDFLAQMLAVRRPSVTTIVGLFARARLIDARRGRIVVTDREGLHAFACECYEIVRATTPKYD
jgi:CRP-like cAMP-binding protein